MTTRSEGLKARIARFLSGIKAPEEPSRQEPSQSSGAGLASAYWSDSPISVPSEDVLDRLPFARRIAETIARRHDSSSLVVGIYGMWGEGKTSLLNLIATDLGRHRDIVVVRFNPWHFRSEEALVQAFFSTLARALGKSLPSMAEKFGSVLRDTAGYLSVASTSIWGVTLDPGGALNKVGERLSKTSLEDLRARVEKLLEEASKRVVVLMDDIDRLDRVEIQASFKLVKLSAGFRRLSYILAMDDQHVAESLGERYGAGDRESGRQFLEKIVQVPLRLPAADVLSLRKLAFDGVNEALRIAGAEFSQEDAQRFVVLFARGFESCMTTPRQARRYGNALMFALPSLRNEVNVIDLLLIEAVRVFYPELHQAIRRRSSLFIGRAGDGPVKQEARQALTSEIDGALDGVNVDEQRGIRRVLEYLFPRVGNSAYGSEWERIWATTQRICSEDYFERYFTYAVSHRDISDLKVDAFLEGLPALNAEQAQQAFRELVSREAAPRAIRKLRIREDTVDPGAIENLSLAVAHNGDLFPRDDDFFSFLATISQAGILVSRVLRRLQMGHVRVTVARRVIEAANPLAFAAQVLRWLRTGIEEPDDVRILPVDVERELGTVLAARIREAAQSRSILDQDRDGIPSLLWIWADYGGLPGEVGAYLAGEFKSNPRRVPPFLLSFIGSAWGMMDGLPSRAEFTRDAYDAVAKFISPDLIFSHLKSVYGPDIELVEYIQGRDLPVDKAVARQFAFLHTHPSAEAEGEEGAPSQEPIGSKDEAVESASSEATE